jgi:hypothetical protein
VEDEFAGEYSVYILHVHATADGTWVVQLDGTRDPITAPLQPLMLTMRLWHAHETGLLRGMIRLHGTDLVAPIQTNNQLEQIVRHWLLGDNQPT